MKLGELLNIIKPIAIVGDTDVEITGVNIDFRQVQNGHLFVAIKGINADGQKEVSKAIKKGAKTVLCEELPKGINRGTADKTGVTYIQVLSVEEAVGPVATVFYGEPSKKLKLVGVTGTNGKTTIATSLYNLFRKLGHKCGLISTVSNYKIYHPMPYLAQQVVGTNGRS